MYSITRGLIVFKKPVGGCGLAEQFFKGSLLFVPRKIFTICHFNLFIYSKIYSFLDFNGKIVAKFSEEVTFSQYKII